MRHLAGCIVAVASLLVGGCSGNYSGTPAPAAAASGGSSGGASASFATAKDFFAAQVEPNLGFCRTCHVPGGVADTPGSSPANQGNLFLLSSDPGQDYDRLAAAWTALGKGVTTNKLLTNPSDPAQNHSGGQPWPVSSQAYKAMQTLLGCWDNPAGCAALIGNGGSSGGPVAQQRPLLGSMHGSSAMQDFCEGPDGNTPQADTAALPTDPRTLIRPGVNQGKAVYFNAFWDNCHAALPASEQAPKTCGEFRARRELGRSMLREGFAADTGSAMTAAQFNSTWKSWGLSARPANFDEMYTLRYGENRANYFNPYPIAKADGTLEDPNAPGVNGGSGQLPLGMRQLKDAGGKWTSTIGTEACAGCHGGQIGDPSEGPGLGGMYGLGNANTDPTQKAADANQKASDQNVIIPIGLGAGLLSGQRGQSDAVTAFELLDFVVQGWDSVNLVPNAAPTKYPGTHPRSWQDAPSWWNVGHRPRKFFDAGVSMDAHRILNAAGEGPGLLQPNSGAANRAYIDKYDKALAAYQESVRSPVYPADPALGGPIDTALAEQGAILFHTKNLWADPRNAARPKPLGGNGSCAGCHGAYSPRFVHDPSYLDSPALEGVAAHISPLNVIGTDPNRANQLATDFADVWDTSWWSYPEGQPGYVSPASQTDAQGAVEDAVRDQYVLILAGQRTKGVCTWRPGVIGYQAPPLYGVWATAPYFHNGSIPTVWQVLDSSKRPQMWRRKLQTIGPVTGFDQRLKTAYDFQNLGWKHDVLSCASYASDPFLSCNPASSSLPSVGTMALSLIQANLVFTAAVNPQYLTNMDRRLIFDTRVFAQSNAGHEFTDVLTDAERRAIIEYLKTL